MGLRVGRRRDRNTCPSSRTLSSSDDIGQLDPQNLVLPCYGERAFPGDPSRSRLAVYHALADRPSRCPSIGEVLAFERDLATIREKLQRLEEEAGPAPHEEAPFR